MSKCRTCQYDSETYNLICKSCIHKPMIEDHYRPVSNADHIRAMTDKELVDFLWQFNDDSFENVMPFCKNTVECGEKLDSNDISTEMCKQCLLDKLRQPYESNGKETQAWQKQS